MNNLRDLLVICFSTFIITWIFANPNVYLESYEYAKQVCEQHEGLKYLDEDKTEYSEAVCNNGIVIEYNTSKLEKSK